MSLETVPANERLEESVQKRGLWQKEIIYPCPVHAGGRHSFDVYVEYICIVMVLDTQPSRDVSTTSDGIVQVTAQRRRDIVSLSSRSARK